MLMFDVPFSKLDHVVLLLAVFSTAPQASPSSQEIQLKVPSKDTCIGKVVIGSTSRKHTLNHWNAMRSSPRRQGVWSPQTAKTAAHLFAMDAMRLSIRLWGILFHSSRSAISKSRTVAGGLGLAAMRRPSMSQTCSIGFRSESTLAIPYAVLFQLQACSPPDELYVVGHYHPGKQRNLQWLQRKG
ncbi:synaptotagmin-1 [Trichonephila clavipes]|nr:synaptotagmin-1 [Trichonephila clavipes]